MTTEESSLLQDVTLATGNITLTIWLTVWCMYDGSPGHLTHNKSSSQLFRSTDGLKWTILFPLQILYITHTTNASGSIGRASFMQRK
jgi:hypothetical protein